MCFRALSNRKSGRWLLEKLVRTMENTKQHPEWIRRLPKSDLHCHLDGSLRLSSLIDLARERGITLPSNTEEGLRELVFKEQYEDLPDYLNGFAYTCAVLTDAEALERYNPRACADRWTTPTLILHGEKDYRVPIGEAIALFEALQHRGVHSELCVFPDENHWILKPRNVVAWYEAWIGFLGRVVG